MLLDDIQSLGFLTEILDDNNGTAANLTGLALFVDLAQTGPFTEFFVRIHTDQGDLMFVTEGSNELLVVGFVKRLSQDTQSSLTPKMYNTNKPLVKIYTYNQDFYPKLTCPKLCRLGGYREQDRQQSMTFSKLLAKLD